MTELPNDIQEIDRRLEKARQPRKNASSKNLSLSVITEAAFRVTLDFASPIIVAASIGYISDKIFATKPFILIIAIIFGVIAGMLNIYKAAIHLENKTSGDK